jgi:outer membrane immunogenic protein
MKKLLLAMTAVAALSGPALAADLSPRTYTKAPVMPVAPSWTGFYIFGGAGGGVWDADNHSLSTATGLPLAMTQKSGGDGWFGTVGAGYDWQFNHSWVFGILADGQFGSLRGNLLDAANALQGSEKLRTSYAAGARLGYLVAPNVLSYVNAGYAGAEWSSASLYSSITGAPSALSTKSFHQDGVFVGGGVENNLDIFGISAPGWFMKTEYRAAYYERTNLQETIAGVPAATTLTFKPLEQTVSTSLVYRFNWTGPVVAKY